MKGDFRIFTPPLTPPARGGGPHGPYFTGFPFLFSLFVPFTLERDRWLLWVPVGVGVGIAGYFALPTEPSLWWLGATPLFGLGAWAARRYFTLALSLMVLLCFALGFNAAQLETVVYAAPMMDRQIGPLSVTGKLMVTETMPDGVRLTLKNPEIGRLPPEKTPQEIRLRMKDKTLADVPYPGSLVRVMAQVGPFSEPVAPDAYNFRRQSFFQGLGGTGWARGAIETVAATSPLTFGENFSLLFERARHALTRDVYADLSGDKAAMTAALLNGQQNSISKDVMQAMRVSGLSHLLSISGVHVSMMGLLVYYPLRALLALIPWIALRFPIKKIAAALAIVSTLFYTLLVGPQAPTLRSMLSTGILMFAIVVDRRTLSMRLVALAATLVMLLQPDGVMGPSFQMSFAAVLCMVAAFEKPLDRALTEGDVFTLPTWLAWLKKHGWTILLTSLVATAATAPFTIYHFQTFSFYGVVANMIAIPLTSFWIMPNILLAYLAAPFGLDGLFITAAGAGVWLIIEIAEVVAAWPVAQIHFKAMPDSAFALIVFGGFWLCLWRRRWRYLGLVPLAAGSLYMMCAATPDLWVSPDGKEWAARLANGTMVVSNLDRDHFTVNQWQQRLGNPDMLDVDELPSSEKQVRCDAMGCVYRHGAAVVALPILESAALEDCEKASLVIAPFLIRDCAAPQVIDDPVLWHRGAQAITFKDDRPVIKTVRDRLGGRPWSPGYRGVE